jgi:multisubunit Na+/H+ antiporter MnhB subunit
MMFRVSQSLFYLFLVLAVAALIAGLIASSVEKMRKGKAGRASRQLVAFGLISLTVLVVAIAGFLASIFLLDLSTDNAFLNQALSLGAPAATVILFACYRRRI